MTTLSLLMILVRWGHLLFGITWIGVHPDLIKSAGSKGGGRGPSGTGKTWP